MKKILLIFIIQFSLFTFCFSQTIQKIKIEDVVKMIDSSKTPVIINFWATWCKPCVEEIPRLEKNVAQYQQQNAQLILISEDLATDYPAKLISFVQAHNYTSKIYWLDENDPQYFCPKIDSNWAGRIPAIVMVNNAKHYREFYNYSLADYQMEAYLKDLITR